MAYKVILYEQAQDDLAKLASSEPKAFAKAQRFIEELKEHPKTGTGHPEMGNGLVKSLRNTDSFTKFTIQKSSY